MKLREALERAPMLIDGMERDRIEGMFGTTAAEVVKTLVDEVEKRGKK